MDIRIRASFATISAIVLATVIVPPPSLAGAAPLSLDDVTPPTVTSYAPTGIYFPIQSIVTADFSEAVIGVDETTFTLVATDDGVVTPVDATVVYDDNLHRATLTPSANLDVDGGYSATLEGGDQAIRDTAGNPLATTIWGFRTSGDVTSPFVKVRKPADGESAVSRSANVSALFNEVVTGVNPTTFKLTNLKTKEVVPARVFNDRKVTKWVLDPTSTLAPRTRYAAKLAGGPDVIRDWANNPLVTTRWVFTTGDS